MTLGRDGKKRSSGARYGSCSKCCIITSSGLTRPKTRLVTEAIPITSLFIKASSTSPVQPRHRQWHASRMPSPLRLVASVCLIRLAMARVRLQIERASPIRQLCNFGFPSHRLVFQGETGPSACQPMRGVDETPSGRRWPDEEPDNVRRRGGKRSSLFL